MVYLDVVILIVEVYISKCHNYHDDWITNPTVIEKGTQGVELQYRKGCRGASNKGMERKFLACFPSSAIIFSEADFRGTRFFRSVSFSPVREGVVAAKGASSVEKGGVLWRGGRIPKRTRCFCPAVWGRAFLRCKPHFAGGDTSRRPPRVALCERRS